MSRYGLLAALLMLFTTSAGCPLESADNSGELMDVDAGAEEALLPIGADCRCPEESCIADAVNCSCQSDEGPCEAELTCLGGQAGECTHACESDDDCPEQFVCSRFSVFDPVTDEEHVFPAKWCLFGG